MPTDAELLERSRAGQRAAFAELVERYQNLVFATTLGGTGDRELAADLAQETFVSAWTSLPSLREESRFRSWLCGIARNLVGKVKRTAGREAPVDGADIADAGPDALELLSSEESDALVRGILDQMPSGSREPLVLFYWEGRSAKEVAARLGISVSAVEQRLSRGRRHIRAELEGIVERTLESARPKKGFAAVVLASIEGLTPSGGDAGADGTPARDAPGVAHGGARAEGTAAVAQQSAAAGTSFVQPWAAVLLLGAAGALAAGWVLLDDSGDREAPLASTGAVAPAGDALSPRAGEATSATPASSQAAAPPAQEADAVAVADADAGWRVGANLTMHEFPNRVIVNLLGGPSTMSDEAKQRLEDGGAMPYNKSGKVLDRPMRRIAGTVTDGEGNPMAGVAVLGGASVSARSIRRSNPELQAQGGAMTDAEGQFVFETTTKGIAVTAVDSTHGWSELVRVPAGEATVDLDLELRGHSSIHGDVSYEGAPTMAYLSFLSADSGDDAGGLVVQMKTDDNGAFEHPLPPGRYIVAAVANLGADAGWNGEQGPQARAETEVKPGEKVRLDLEFHKGVTVELRATPPRSLTYYVFPGQRYEDWAAASASLGDPRTVGNHVGATPDDEESFAVIHDVPVEPMTVCAVARFKKFEKPDYTECRYVAETPDPDVGVSVTFHPPPAKD